MDVMWSVVKCEDHQLWEYPFHLLPQTLLFSPPISKYLLELMINISNEILLPQAPARTFITHESLLHSPALFWLYFAGDKKLPQRTADGHQARGRDGDVRWRHGGRSWEQGLRGFRYEDALQRMNTESWGRQLFDWNDSDHPRASDSFAALPNLTKMLPIWFTNLLVNMNAPLCTFDSIRTAWLPCKLRSWYHQSIATISTLSPLKQRKLVALIIRLHQV